MLEREPLPFPVKRVYMGVNLESRSLLLPTTRLLLAAQRARGRSTDLAAEATPPPAGRGRNWRRHTKDAARLAVWVLEEWLRRLVASTYARRGYLVVFDRHFYADYYHTDVTSGSGRGIWARLHGWMLENAYPKPDLVICLDAPGDVLHNRKPEASPAWLEQRRRQYLSLASVLPRFAVVDADRSLATVFADVVDAISSQRKDLTT